MGQRPIAVRVKADTAAGAAENDRVDDIIVSVGEAARRLDVSERTVFRLLKTGALERVDVPLNALSVKFNDRLMADMNTDKMMIKGKISPHATRLAANDVSHDADMDAQVQVGELKRQLEEKDAQIARMLLAQQELTQTNRRLHEQMYEMAHLVLSHNVAAAQARAEAELKAQEQALTDSRRGLSSLLGPRKRT